MYELQQALQLLLLSLSLLRWGPLGYSTLWCCWVLSRAGVRLVAEFRDTECAGVWKAVVGVLGIRDF